MFVDKLPDVWKRFEPDLIILDDDLTLEHHETVRAKVTVVIAANGQYVSAVIQQHELPRRPRIDSVNDPLDVVVAARATVERIENRGRSNSHPLPNHLCEFVELHRKRIIVVGFIEQPTAATYIGRITSARVRRWPRRSKFTSTPAPTGRAPCG